MGQLLLFIVVALTVAAIVFGVTVMMSGGDSGLTPVEPDGRALPLPGDRPLGEEDVVRARFDTALRGYRMSQVDQALQRAAYDIGYKGELISVLEAEVTALREGRTADADVLRRAREAAAQPIVEAPAEPYHTDPPAAPVPASAAPAAGGPVGPADPRTGAAVTTSSPDSAASTPPPGRPVAAAAPGTAAERPAANRVDPDRTDPESSGPEPDPTRTDPERAPSQPAQSERAQSERAQSERAQSERAQSERAERR